MSTTPFLDSLLGTRAPAGPHAWLETLRRDALEAAHRLALPTRTDEDWRFTDLSALYKRAFRAASPMAASPASTLASFEIPEATHRIVFMDGVFAPEQSRLPTSAGLEIASVPTDAARVHLASLAPIASDPFVAINTAHLQRVALIVARRDHTVRAPVHVLFVNSQPSTAAHPRMLVVAERGAEISIIEEYAGLHEDVYLQNGVTEIVVEPNAGVRHVRLQRDAKAAFHIGTCAVRLARDARYTVNSIALGAAISRLNLNLRQEAPGARMEADGLALIDGSQLADTHSFIAHAAPDGTSRQVHRTVLAGGAHAVFNGRILVEKGAQRTDSAQESRNLLLSGRAHIDTKPQLEIFADDVKCAHGATVGQLEAEELFYLRSRGLSLPAARNLLTYAFAAEIVDRIGVPSLVERLERLVLERTAQ